MSFPFAWNEFADQPHNVAPKGERLRYHFQHAGSYVDLTWSNIVRAAPILANLARCRAGMYKRPVILSNAFGLAVSPSAGGDADPLDFLAETGVRETLLRIPSWEKAKLADYERFARRVHDRGFGLVLALLQRRDDVFDRSGWTGFLDEVFDRFGPLATHFEIGHAWNRTKWGLWSFREYLDLARSAFDLAPSRGVKLVGPAVIDFEFHLYPPTLPRLPFDKVSSLLYVDRTGPPESRQFGWSAAGKAALLKAVVDASARGGRDIWVTEVNWPLKGTGPYSPAAGRPNVSEDEQASYLVRYYVPLLAGGLVERIYWWQLAAPGYGLIDTRDGAWRRRPSFAAFRTLVRELDGSEFIGRAGRGPARVFHFRKGDRYTAVAWSSGRPCEFEFALPARRVWNRDGAEAPGSGARRFRLEGSPLYVVFSERPVP